MNLLGNRVFADVIKERISAGPKSKVSALTTESKGHTKTQRGRSREDGGRD